MEDAAKRGATRWPTKPWSTRLALGLSVVLASSGCHPPDRPVRAVQPLPPALVTYLEPDTVRARFLQDGITYHYAWSPKGPWAVHFLTLELERCDLGLAVLPAGEDGPADAGLATVSELVNAVGDGVLAAVNGDFFTPEGRPMGPEVSDGRLLRSRARPAFSWRPREEPWIGTSRVGEGGSLGVGFWVSASDEPLAQVVGGFPELLDEGRAVMQQELDPTQSFASFRHPRTAVGYDPAARRLWLVVVDGRQGAYSSGMTLEELTDALSAVGATEALNLDGGGSSIMVVRGKALSRPSDDSGERAVRNALAVVSDQAYCRPAR